MMDYLLPPPGEPVGSGAAAIAASQPRMAVVEITFVDSPYALPVTSTEVHVDTSGGPVIVQLPAPADCREIFYGIKRTSSNTHVLTIDATTNGGTLDGNPTALFGVDGTRGYIGITSPATGTDFKLT